MMKFAIVVLAFVTLTFAAPNGSIVPMLDGRIVGGTKVNITDFPYQLSLRFGTSHICGAVIISADVALTAAHCVDGFSVNYLSIRAGSSFHKSGGDIHSISSVVAHALYVEETADYDIAVIRVSSPFNLGSSGVAAISLPSAGSNPTAGVSAIVSGWGELSFESGNYPDQLLAVTVPIITQESCRASYGTSNVTDRMLCAGYTEGGKDACSGDSGGPLVVGGELVGLVSWGDGCAGAGNPGVYTHIGNLRTWISRNSGV